MYSKPTRKFLPVLMVVLTCSGLYGQTNSSDSLLQEATLDNVVRYALAHQPIVQQAIIDQAITDRMIKGKLSDWYPQINFLYNYQHNIILQQSVIGGNLIRFGVNNTSSAQLNATQNFFNRDVLLAANTADQVRIQAGQNTEKNKIEIVVAVSKAFYDWLATAQQIKVGDEDIIRLQRSLKDAQSRYNAGIADKTDYKRATILLTNAKAQLTGSKEALKFKEEYLKRLMGYPTEGNLQFQYDTLQMESEIPLDTMQGLSYTSHIDYKITYLQRELQDASVKYSYWGFIPSATAFGSYILNFQNNAVSELYAREYPYSYVGATLAFPIFQGGKRNLKIQEQKWALKRLDWQLVSVKNELHAAYAQSLAAYKSNLALYLAQKENVELAREVYDVIEQQYRSGVKAYIDVTIAETDLRAARINYFNALYQVLASKMDVQKALGQVDYNKN